MHKEINIEYYFKRYYLDSTTSDLVADPSFSESLAFGIKVCAMRNNFTKFLSAVSDIMSLHFSVFS